MCGPGSSNSYSIQHESKGWASKISIISQEHSLVANDTNAHA